MLVAHFRTFGRYNRWANRRLYGAVAQLADAQYRENRGAFFGSVHGTLNHLVVADRMWRSRISGEATPHVRLDEIAHEGFAELRVAREVEDEWIERFTDGLDEARLAGTVTYRRASRPESISQSLASLLAHVFNHQTHHRGQVHALLTGLSGGAPELDLIYYLRETGTP